MQWKLDKYTFDAQTNLLIGPAGEMLLEPKVSALFKYFLENQKRDISRDELIEFVWGGQIVTDGAINRVVVQLRRALADDAKIKRMIITVPKVGYRFVFDAELIEHGQIPVRPEFKLRYGHVAFTAAVLIAAALWFWPSAYKPMQNANLSPMVRLASIQSDAAFAQRSGQLVYVQKTETGSELYLAAQADAPAVQVGEPDGQVNSPSWSADNKLLAYRHIQSGICMIRVIHFSGNTTPSDRPVYRCKPSPRISLAFNLSGNELYFTANETPYGPARVYALNFEKGSSRRLEQPLAKDKGNHHLDIHPVSGELLLLHDRAPGKTSAYRLAAEAGTFERLIDWPYKVDSAIWGHKGGTIVHPGMHPSYGLLETKIKTGKPQTLVSDSRRIKEAARIENGKDYLFTSYINNQDIVLDGTQPNNLNSSVMDYLATLSRDGTRLAFISKRSGKSRIWINNLATGVLRSLSFLIEGQSLRTLDWSYDNRRLLVSTSAGIAIVDANKGTAAQNITPASTVYGASWSGENEISYSLYDQNRWQVFHYNLTEKRTTLEGGDWAFILKSLSREVRIDQQFRIFENGVEILQGQCTHPLRLQDLTIRLSGNDLFCISAANTTNIIRLDAQGNRQDITDTVSNVRHYSAANGRTARTEQTNMVSDIMRTMYPEN